ncbi:uncharacterized protein LOC106158636 [Lingula anatina]|uniref:Uncharacterized protein LOC106158636 n=1 Tax=Lingula anatina TaxID=7574 RepID=A0A1S3HVW8_LINAN|nr:uncharacterized protein LOC106158636 [Lingula anatina]|eukprot:XP_013390163.1 uncharacterized protein LOC106158636 [Lingula anatina]
MDKRCLCQSSRCRGRVMNVPDNRAARKTGVSIGSPLCQYHYRDVHTKFCCTQGTGLFTRHSKKYRPCPERLWGVLDDLGSNNTNYKKWVDICHLCYKTIDTTVQHHPSYLPPIKRKRISESSSAADTVTTCSIRSSSQINREHCYASSADRDTISNTAMKIEPGHVSNK